MKKSPNSTNENGSFEKSIEARQDGEKKLLLEQLRKTPIIQVACERAGVGRTTYYRWRKEDEKFKEESDDALRDGEEFITEMSEGQLIALIKEKNFSAISLWLRQHHPKYSNKLEVTATIKNDEALTPEQEALVREALGLANDEPNNANHGKAQS
jgi:hypothetical protein